MPEDKPTVYLAGAIRDAPDNGREWRTQVEEQYADDFDFINPLDEYELVDEGGTSSTTCSASPTHSEEMHEPDVDDDERVPGYVVEGDKENIRHSDAMLVRWYHDEDITSVGTPMEILYAHDLVGIPIVVWLDTEFIDRLEVSGWLYHHTNGVVTKLDDAMFSLKTFVDSKLTNGVSETERMELFHGGLGDGGGEPDGEMLTGGR